MNVKRIRRLLKQEESLRLEFKEAKTTLPSSLFETICAFLNREGGDIILGVGDSGKIIGIDPSVVPKLIHEIVALSSNLQKLDPPNILFPQEYKYDARVLIHISVPESSQVHKSTNIVYDRSDDGDFKVTTAAEIAKLYNRKRIHYTEGIIYPVVRFNDLNRKLFTKARNLIKSTNPSHPWLNVDDQQMLQLAGLHRRDTSTGDSGYTLAAVLLFGKDHVIKSTLPHYKIDALVRKVNIDRYDDRLTIHTNLIDAYDILMEFIAKHLPDKFAMEGGQRISLRTKIFREVVANILVHREYTNAQVTTLIVYNNRVETENANNPHGKGPIVPEAFSPFPKNPLIANFFQQLGRVEELGSGVLNVNNYSKLYTPGKRPLFEEGNTFKTAIAVDAKIAAVASTAESILDACITFEETPIVRKRLVKILDLLAERSKQKTREIQIVIEVSERTVKSDLKKLIDHGLIVYKGSAKSGGYYLSSTLQKKLTIQK
jgi:ATP-dependent DNA helicase RecG